MVKKYTLHKLPEGFIATSDEEKQTLDLVWNPDVKKLLRVSEVFMPHGDKVIAQQHQIDFSSLSEEEQKEIGYFDVEKLALKEFMFPEKLFHSMKNSSQNEYLLEEEYGKQNTVVYFQYIAFIKSFQKLQELLSDRRFTEEDLKDASIMYAQWLIGGTPSLRVAQNPEERFKQIIESLSQPKSWSVEGEWNEDKFNLKKLEK